MSVVTIIGKGIPKKRKAEDVPFGTIFTGSIGGYRNSLFKRICDGSKTGTIVSLDGDSTGIWSGIPEIAEYCEVDIEIRIL